MACFDILMYRIEVNMIWFFRLWSHCLSLWSWIIWSWKKISRNSNRSLLIFAVSCFTILSWVSLPRNSYHSHVLNFAAEAKRAGGNSEKSATATQNLWEISVSQIPHHSMYHCFYYQWKWNEMKLLRNKGGRKFLWVIYVKNFMQIDSMSWQTHSDGHTDCIRKVRWSFLTE